MPVRVPGKTILHDIFFHCNCSFNPWIFLLRKIHRENIHHRSRKKDPGSYHGRWGGLRSFAPLENISYSIFEYCRIRPNFRTVAGDMWGPIAFLRIVLGSIFAGGVHDYFSGMLSIKHNGESITEITGYYLGDFMKKIMSLLSVLLMILVGAVFIIGPASIIEGMTSGFAGTAFRILLILSYYILSTLLPIDKLIGKVYPFFGAALIFMAVGIAVVLVFGNFNIPELTFAAFSNPHVNQDDFPIFPMLLITIACNAISGFHATQSPLLARCVTNEKQGRSIFYGAMATEGILALIWAALSMTFFGGVQDLNSVMVENQNNAAYVVNEISNSMLGKVGGFLALLGVIGAPITSGDSAFRSARLIIADFFKVQQKAIKNRLAISIPIFIAGYALTLIEFGIVWRYFAWTNKTLATIVLWVITAYLIKEKANYIS